jgi:hypothetical protein
MARCVLHLSKAAPEKFIASSLPPGVAQRRLASDVCSIGGASEQCRMISQFVTRLTQRITLAPCKTIESVVLFLGCFEGFQGHEGQEGQLFALR